MEGTIYPILRRLTKICISKHILESNEGPARKYYRITSLGKENLSNLMEEWRREFVKAVEILISEGGGNELE